MAVWSFSASKQFLRCQRQWFFKNHYANSRAKRQPERREAYLLSKLDSIFAWRGKIVDKIISDHVVRSLHFGSFPNREHVLRQARELFDQQLAFARAHRLREPGMKVSEAGDTFAAFRDVEQEGAVAEDLITRAWHDVEAALLNLFSMSDLLARLSNANQLLAQRTLMFSLDGIASEPITVRAVPDLIAFYEDIPPLIVDWKVHSFGRMDYRLQLASYALALVHCRPHKDFPLSLSLYTPMDLALHEVQLLTQRQRPYSLTEKDVFELETYIAETAMMMELALSVCEGQVPTPLDLPVTRYPETCARCSFSKLCWEESIWEEDLAHESKQMSLF